MRCYAHCLQSGKSSRLDQEPRGSGYYEILTNPNGSEQCGYCQYRFGEDFLATVGTKSFSFSSSDRFRVTVKCVNKSVARFGIDLVMYRVTYSTDTRSICLTLASRHFLEYEATLASSMVLGSCCANETNGRYIAARTEKKSRQRDV